MKTISPPQKPEVKSAQQAPKPNRASHHVSQWQTFPQKNKNKNSPNTTSQDQALPISQPSMYVRYLYPTFTNSRQQKPIEP